MVTYVLPIIEDDILSTYKEAMKNLESVEWKVAMDKKIQYLHKNQENERKYAHRCTFLRILESNERN